MTYPNGRVITSNYMSGLDADISRLSELKDGSTVLEGYSYLGLGTVVVRSHPQPGVDLSFVKLSGESVGDAGDQYTGLDRFGRIVDQRWRAGSTDKDRYQYTYDRNSNRTAETNVLSSSFNETYTYDSLNQLTGFNRNSGARTQSFDFDALGNWDSVTTNGNAQTRTHNKQNEITAVSGATTPVFDAAGNMTTDETGKQYVYDAWNRLVTVKNSGGTTIATFVYDALTRRVSETASSVTTDLYYSVQWQVVEEHVSGTARISYVWSPVYVDAMVARDRDSDNNGSLDERLYVTHDANFNVGALIDTSGAVVERFAYDPFGVVSYLNASFGSISASTVAWKYLHQGGRLNADSGFYSFRYREYSPTLGRWTTMDPIGYYSLSNNLFAYESNSSTTVVDSSGLAGISPGLVITLPGITVIGSGAIAVGGKVVLIIGVAGIAFAIGYGIGWVGGTALGEYLYPTPSDYYKPKGLDYYDPREGTSCLRINPSPGPSLDRYPYDYPIEWPRPGPQPQPIPEPPEGPRRRMKWRCTTKPRGVCPEKCHIFVGYGLTRDTAYVASQSQCYRAGCHTPGGHPYNCNCGHVTCHPIPN